MKKTLLCAVLCLALCLALTPAAAAETQYDILPASVDRPSGAVRDLPESKQPDIQAAVTEPEGEETAPAIASPDAPADGDAPAGGDAPANADAPADSPGDDAFPYGAPVNGVFPNAGALYDHWQRSRGSYEASPYPPYICGVWSTDGDPTHLTFAVTKDEVGEAGKKEILSQVADGSTVSFTYQSYPYAELWAAQLDLQTHLGDETGAFAIGIHETDNTVHISIDMDNENAAAFMEDAYSRYGAMLSFEGGDGIMLTSEDFLANTCDAGMGGGYIWRLALCCALALAVFGAAAFARSRRVPVYQTVHGSVPAPMSRRAVENALRKSTLTPDGGVLQAIRRELDGPGAS